MNRGQEDKSRAIAPCNSRASEAPCKGHAVYVVRRNQTTGRRFPRQVGTVDAGGTVVMRTDGGVGYCTACGRKAKGFVEPDAEGYTCGYRTCGKPAVCGAEQLLLMTAI